jgi:6-phosphogluconolactonase
VKIEVHPRGRFIMAVSGGRTPWLMLRALADEQIPWESVHVVQVDERAAPAGDPDRNLAHLLDGAKLNQALVGNVRTCRPDVKGGVQEQPACRSSRGRWTLYL